MRNILFSSPSYWRQLSFFPLFPFLPAIHFPLGIHLVASFLRVSESFSRASLPRPAHFALVLRLFPPPFMARCCPAFVLWPLSGSQLLISQGSTIYHLVRNPGLYAEDPGFTLPRLRWFFSISSVFRLPNTTPFLLATRFFFFSLNTRATSFSPPRRGWWFVSPRCKVPSLV